MRPIRHLIAFTATAVALTACSDDGGPTDDPTDTGVDAAEDTGTDTADTGGDDTGDDTSTDTGTDVVEDGGADVTEDADVGGQTGPLSCDGSADGTISPTDGLVLEVDVEGGATGLRFDFLGREVTGDTPASITCGGDSIVPDGYTAISPAFTLTADSVALFDRRYFVIAPIDLTAVPENAGPSAVRIFWRDGDEGDAVSPVVANLQENMVRGTVRFESELTGTFQFAVADNAGTTYEREWSFRAITGVSMGASGASMIGMRNPDEFDIIAPLGGPTDWTYLANYIREGGMGGFNPAPDFGRAAFYEPTQQYEHPQAYDEWWYPAGEGTGGAFNRSDYAQIFLDLMLTFGNMVNYNPESPYRAVGLPADELLRTAAERCNFTEACGTNEGVFTIETGYYDNEYNPDGSLPVITFCDGRGSRDTELEFSRACDLDFNGRPDETNEGLYDDPCIQNRPVDITFAVDVNGNGLRDPGEPIIRNFFEPFEDVGTDGIASEDEEGYDPITNPDPAGDDYDFMTNPFGTEGNWLRNEGEPFDDFGLDGVEGTPQFADGGYDFGEGNGTFDYNPNLERLLFEFNPNERLKQLTDEEREGLTLYIDAGVRDLFNFVVGSNQLAGTLHGLGGNVRVYDGFWSAQDLLPEESDDYNFTEVDYENLGDNVFVRYGSLDASEEDIYFGDGKHVGTVEQIAFRLLTMLGFVTNRFPDGDRSDITALTDAYPIAGGTYFVPSPSTGGQLTYSVALPPGVEWTQCSDGRDNDGDGLNDGDDPDCQSAMDLSETSDEITTVCNDGIDNDSDLLVDEDDPDCADGNSSEWPSDFPLLGQSFPVIYLLHGYGQTPDELQVTAVPFSGFMAQGRWPKAILVFPDGFCGRNERNACNDGIDNDGDGSIDGDDEGCGESGNTSETGERRTFCNDGVDNDNDGLTDLEDGGCSSEAWNSEANCLRGTFYTDHAAWPDGSADGPNYEEQFFELVDHIDDVYPTRQPETFPQTR